VIVKPSITTRKCKCKQEIIFKLKLYYILNFNYILDTYVCGNKCHVFMNLDIRYNSRILISVNLQFPTFRNRISVSSSPIGWPQPSVTNYSMPLNIPERRRRRFQGGGSIKSRNLGIFILPLTILFYDCIVCARSAKTFKVAETHIDIHEINFVYSVPMFVLLVWVELNFYTLAQ